MFKNSLERTRALSDGIFAVVLTIMVLNIQVPHALTSTALQVLARQIIIYLVSFSVVCQYWLFHQEIFTQLTKLPNPLLVTNLYYLAAIALIPFTTAWFNGYPLSQLVVFFFSLVLVIVNFLQYRLFRLVIRHYDQLSAHDHEELLSAKIQLWGSVGYWLIGSCWPVTLLPLIILSMGTRVLVAKIKRSV
ncbi:TMEM175 family protein [Furfurilactobacillus sp. WILCCON 0119]|uniref:TMEM175 family protein n=1 Tax=Furfurilactobacillus entadae TaxID=2922307 RepID=UPI0035EFF08E